MLNQPLKFGKHKGKTWNQLLSSDDGRGYIAWFIQQPCSNPEYAQKDEELKQVLTKAMEVNAVFTEPSPSTSGDFLTRTEFQKAQQKQKEINEINDRRIDTLYSLVSEKEPQSEPGETLWSE